MPQSQNSVITIARQFGAGGIPLGQRLAQRLGFVYADRDILCQVARQMGMNEEILADREERPATFWERVAGSLCLGPPEGVYTTFAGLPTIPDRSLFELQCRIIRELADQRSAVIIGRAGFWVLKDHPGAIHVFLHAPVEDRVPTVMESYHLATAQEARNAIHRVDQQRDRFILAMTGLAAADVRNYDLCIDTGRVCLDAADQMIALLVEQRLQTAAGRES